MCESEMYANVKFSSAFANASSTQAMGSVLTAATEPAVFRKLRRE